jgi:hypothetical protein
MRRALLVGSQTGVLEGVHDDVERMREALSRQGFGDAVTICTGAQASRDGILAAYERLIADADSGDAVCFYYSGHGNLAPNPYFQSGKPQPRVLQYLIPTDDGPEGFRGIMSFELSRLLARLTLKTRNVTVILDCCHSARMSRAASDRALVPKGGGTSRVSEANLRAFLDQSSAYAGLVDVEGNPHAVRLVAAEAHSLAFERIDEAGKHTGAFTEALLQALAEVGDEPVSWGAVMLRTRELVMGRIPDQRPDAEGPRGRQLWALAQVADERPLPLFFAGTQPSLRGGALLGVVPGGTYGVMPAHAPAYAAERALATAIVEQNVGSVSRVRLEPAGLTGLPETGLLAFPLSVPFRKCTVALAADLPAELQARLAGSRYLLPVEAGGSTGAPAPSVTREGRSLLLRDAGGDLLLQAPDTSLDPLVDRLERVARAEDLRRFERGELDVTLEISFGRIANGARVPMQAGETLHVDDFQYIDVENDGYEPVHVGVLGIDAAYDIFYVLRRAPRGQRLVPKDRLIVGEGVNGTLTGVPVSWPASLPPDRLRTESLIVIAAEDEQDFSLLTTSGRTRGGAASALERRLDQLRGGTTRTRGAQSASGSEYRIYRIDYQLDPRPRS